MPAAAQAKDAVDFILTSHEERLQKVEEGFGEVSKTLSENITTTKHVVEGVKDLGDRFEKAIDDLGRKLANSFESHEAARSEDKKAFTDLAAVVKDLQDGQRKQAERHATLKKVAWGVALPLGGILAKEGGTALFAFIATALQHAK